MKTKLQLGLSKALIKENYKLYWYLPVLSFIAYFMAGIFPLIMNPHYLTDPNHWYLEQCLQNYNVAFVCLLIAAPLVGAIIMMNFLHSQNYAMSIHAQPFSRSKIFWSQALSGWSMCILSPAVMTLIYLVISGQPGNALYFGASSLSIITFFYGCFILAGVLAGTAVMHVLLCGIFFGIVPLIIWLTWMYCEYFLVGFYEMPEWMSDFLFATNPLLYMIEENGEFFSPGPLLLYLAFGLAFTLISSLLYRRAKLEHVGDSMMFRAAEEIITWLVVFVGMSAFGFFFYAVMDEKVMALVGMVTGTLLAFAVVKIVIARTFRIANRQNFLSLGAFTLIAVIFTGCTMYDLTGFTDRVPDADEVVSVERVNFGYGDTFNYWYDYIEDDLLREQETLTTPQAIEKAVALHSYIVKEKLYSDDTVTVGAELYDQKGNIVHTGNTWSTFRYTMKDGSQVSRRFTFYLNPKAADLMNAIVTDPEYKKDGALLSNFTAENISRIELSVYDYSYEYEEKFQNSTITTEEKDIAYRNAQATLILTSREEIERFLNAMNEDHYSRSYTAKTDGTVSLSDTDTDVADMKVVPEAAFEYLDYMDINGNIYLHPGTEGVVTEWRGTAPENGSKPIGTASFNVNSGHHQTLTYLVQLLDNHGYPAHAAHIEESISK